jgi:hypothetical protein
MASRARTKSTNRAGSDLASLLSSAVHPSDAAGLRRAKGLGVNAGVDAFLGLGFPFLIVPTDVEPGAYETCAAFAKAYADDANVMPRAAIAQQYCITIPATPDTPYPEPSSPLPPVRTVVLSEAVREVLAYGNGRNVQQLEVMFGALPLAEELVAQLANLSEESWLARGVAPVIGAGLRHLLWRVPGADRDRLRGVLRGPLASIDLRTSGGKALDVLMSGRAGVERSGSNLNGALHLGDLVSADDDPEWASAMALAKLEKLRPADREWFNPQLVVLCGKKLLDAFRASVAKFPAEHRKRMTALLALFA